MDNHVKDMYELKELLARYRPTLSECAAKKRIESFIGHYANCFERSLSVGHITGSAWLLNKDMSKALLMHHTKLNKWLQLGGHCDGDSQVLRVAVREAQEESGIQHIIPVNYDIFDIDIHLIPATYKEAEHYHYDIRFLLRVDSNEEIVQNHESKELRWIGKEKSELPTQEVSIVRMFDKWLALK